MDGQDTDFPLSSEELSQWVNQLKSEVDKKDKTIKQAQGHSEYE